MFNHKFFTMKEKRIFTQAQRAEIIKLYRGGIGYCKVSKILGLPRRQVRTVLIEEKIEIKKPAYVPKPFSRLTNEEKKKAMSLAKKGYSLREIGVELRKSHNTISHYFKINDYDVGSRGVNSRKYPVNESYFDIIDHPDKAYILGLFYADGSCRIDRPVIQINLSDPDIYMVEAIRDILSPGKKLQLHTKEAENLKESKRLEIQSKRLHKRLIELGCVPLKSWTLCDLPMIPDMYFNDFVRGYFDGDGGVCVPKSGFKEVQVKFRGTESFLKKLQKKMFELDRGLTGSYSNEKIAKGGKNPALFYGGRKQVEQIYRFMYRDLNPFGQLMLYRKYEKFNSYFRRFRSRNLKLIKIKPLNGRNYL